MSDATIQYYGTGRRKTSAARIYLRPGRGEIVVNTQDVRRVLPERDAQDDHPSAAGDHRDGRTSSTSSFAWRGGGPSGQAGALRHGIARALLEYNPELRGKLKDAGFLTRDPRKVERKKYGQPGARKRFQFSKR